MQVKLFTNFRYNTEVEDVAKLFFEEVVACATKDDADIVTICSTGQKGVFCATTTYGHCTYTQQVELDQKDALQATRQTKRCVKVSTYRCLAKATGRSQPWGSLTGIRPTKLAYQLTQREGKDYKEVFRTLFDVSEDKIALVDQILEQQKGLREVDDSSVDLYVGIPFCVSRCSYCSFTGGTIDKLHNYVEPYLEALQYELTTSLQFIKDNGLLLRNVYFGGGTPTSLSASQLESLMRLIGLPYEEFCIEAGRPDTIDKDKLQAMYDCGVNRISVNPQSFNQSVLDAVGRSHSVDNIYSVYQLARSFNFVINMDLIAGLPTESYDMFCKSVDSAVELSPDNITIHTLALKKGSALKEQSYHSSRQGEVADMVRYGAEVTKQAQYFPYYLYRQKYMTDNLENVGYAKLGKQCRYNIDIMEETRSIIACGSNAISKRLFGAEDRIERCANPKDIPTYIQKIKLLTDSKLRLFEK